MKAGADEALYDVRAMPFAGARISSQATQGGRSAVWDSSLGLPISSSFVPVLAPRKEEERRICRISLTLSEAARFVFLQVQEGIAYVAGDE